MVGSRRSVLWFQSCLLMGTAQGCHFPINSCRITPGCHVALLKGLRMDSHHKKALKMIQGVQ